MRNLYFEYVEGCLVMVLSKEDPTDEEWRDFMVLAEAKGWETAQLIHTDGGRPTVVQQRWFNKNYADRARPRVAILSQDSAVRAAAAAGTWFDGRVKAFSPEELEQALTHIHIPASSRATIQGCLGTFRLLLEVARA